MKLEKHDVSWQKNALSQLSQGFQHEVFFLSPFIRFDFWFAFMVVARSHFSAYLIPFHIAAIITSQHIRNHLDGS
jgi:hypothetical protein